MFMFIILTLMRRIRPSEAVRIFTLILKEDDLQKTHSGRGHKQGRLTNVARMRNKVFIIYLLLYHPLIPLSSPRRVFVLRPALREGFRVLGPRTANFGAPEFGMCNRISSYQYHNHISRITHLLVNCKKVFS